MPSVSPMNEFANLSDPDARSSEFATRLMATFEAIALHGPISLNDLAIVTDIPKVSVWRTARSLREFGWVRVRQSDGKMEAAPRFDRLLSAAHIPFPEVDEMEGLAFAFSEFPELTITIGVFSKIGTFAEIESTKRGGDIGIPLSLVNDFQTTAAFLITPPAEIQRHLEAYARDCVADERQMILSGQRLREIIAQARSSPAVWNPDRSQFAVPWVFTTGTAGMIRLSPKKASQSSSERLGKAAEFALWMLRKKEITGRINMMLLNHAFKPATVKPQGN